MKRMGNAEISGITGINKIHPDNYGWPKQPPAPDYILSYEKKHGKFIKEPQYPPGYPSTRKDKARMLGEIIVNGIRNGSIEVTLSAPIWKILLVISVLAAVFVYRHWG